MPGGDPLATCTLPVGDVYLLTYLRNAYIVTAGTRADDPFSVVCCLLSVVCCLLAVVCWLLAVGCCLCTCISVVIVFESLLHAHAIMEGFFWLPALGVCKNGLQSWRQLQRLCSSIDR